MEAKLNETIVGMRQMAARQAEEKELASDLYKTSETAQRQNQKLLAENEALISRIAQLESTITSIGTKFEDQFRNYTQM